MDVVSTTVAWRPLLYGVFVWYGLLREAWKGIILSHDSNDWSSASPGGDESCRDAGDPPLNFEPMLLQLVREELSRLELDEP